MMGPDSSDMLFTQREEDGELIIKIGVVVHQDMVHVVYSTPEHHAEISFDNTAGMSLAEAYSHPAFVARFVEQAIGDGEVKLYYERRSDALASSRTKGSSRARAVR
jgi:hypothetical protein